ncbi:MAG: DUF1963 domain-containing protein, partial [Oscillospiraceae bacterium]|nr:DUF1963 domain-containing protein [Oscillospiraceae bacterium]
MSTIDLDELMKLADEAEKQLFDGMPEEQRKMLENANAQFEQLIKETAGISTQEEMFDLSDSQLNAVNDRLMDMLKEAMGDETYAEMMEIEKKMREKNHPSLEKVPADTVLSQAIKSTLRNAVYLNYKTDAADIPAGGTKFGGKPDVPVDFEWFRTSDGRPLAFLAQFNLNELHEYDKENELPQKGILYFFYDLEEMPWDNLEPDDKCVKVYYFGGDASELSPADFPEDIDDDCVIRQCGLSFEAVTDAPSYDDFPSVSDFPCDDYMAYASSAENALGFDPYERGDIRFKLLGYADVIQNSVLESFAYEENGDWVLLAQFDTYENEESFIMYCDGGRIYIGIKKEDLAAGNFENVKLVL